MEFIDLKTQKILLESSINNRLQKVMDHGAYIMGPEINELEKLEEFSGSKNCITVASGTDALLISLMAIGLQPGEEVITTPFTWVSTVEVITLLGGIPVFADIEPDTCNIDAAQLKDLITDKTRAIIPVSLFGQPADMDVINYIAEKNNLIVIEDGAQSFGAEFEGRKSCNLSHIGCTSFFPSKPLGCYGDGGAIFTNDDEIAKISKQLRVHGTETKHWHTRVGIAGRMDTIQAAVVLAKLDVFQDEVNARLNIGQRYNELFDQNGVPRVKQRSNRTSVFAQYTIFVENRNQVTEKLKEKGIPTAVHYTHPINKSPAYSVYCRDDTPFSDKASEKVLSLPMHPYLELKDQDFIVESLLKCI